jgi:isoquinoline 1-oxidoreductase beta subunit
LQPKDWKLIGTTVRRLDTPEKITGKAQFGVPVQISQPRSRE